MQTNPQASRRGFLKLAGLTAASAALAGARRPSEAAESQPAERSGEDFPFKLGLASYTTRKFDLDATLAMTQRVGLTAICLKSFHLPLDATPEVIAAAVEKARAAGLDLYGGGVITMKDEAQAKEAFAYAKAAGMRTIVGSPAPEVLPLVNELVQQSGIAVAIHNHGPGDKIYPTPESIYEKVQGLDPRIGICMDIGHTARIGADPVADAQRFADRLLDVHLKDVSAAAPAGQTVEIGRGVIDIPGFLKTLLKIKFAQVASFEYEKDDSDPLPGLAESVGYVRGVLATL